MSPEEQKDLDLMKVKVSEEKELMYSMMVEFLRMDETQLKTCGHKTLSSALEATLRSTQKDIKKLHDSHIRKYPD